MSRADQIARQQRRAFSVLRDTLPATVVIGDYSYDVALITGTASHDTDLGVLMTPDSITFWLPKCAYDTEPAVRARVTHDEIAYFIDEVSGRGEAHENWRVRAVRHRAA